MKINLKNKKRENVRENVWNKAILIERNKSHHVLMEHGISFVSHKDNALILGDACKVNSRFLIEQENFKNVDNVDQSALVLDDYYQSQNLHVFQSLFGHFNYPINKYDFVYGKSISFIKKDITQKVLEKIKNSLKKDGIFVSQWFLLGNTNVPLSGIWDKEEIKRIIQELNMEIIEMIEEDKLIPNLKNITGSNKSLKIILKK